jgi:hypothetical protein
MVDSLSALRARDDLLAVAAAWPSLKARLVPSGVTSDGVHTAPGSRPPFVVAVSDILFRIEQHARFLGRVLIEETHDFAPRTSTMPGLLVEVAHRYGHHAGPDADEKTALDYCDEAHELRRAVAHTLARNEPARWAGPCPEDECAGELYLRVGTDAKCRECARIVGPVEWRELMEAAFDDRLMTLSEIVSALVITDHRVPEKTVRTWAWRGANHGDPTRGLVPVYVEPTLYRFADAHALAERRAGRKSA